MSDLVLVALISALPPTIVAAGAIVIGIMNKRGIEDLHVAVNSRLTELLELTAKSARAEGKADRTR